MTGAQSDSFLMTAEGMVLGTPTYMSPEQARGQQVDKRSDIWAFGCVLYECLTAKRTFAGEAFGDLIAAILEHEVDLDALPKGTPPRVRELITRCLVKDPRRRLRDIGEARLVLEEPRAASEDASRTTERPPRTRMLLASFAAVAAAAALGGWWIGRQARGPAESWSRFTQLTDDSGAETSPVLSPDGGSFAYASRAAGSWDIYVQRVGGRTRTRVAADPDRDEAWPAFSPDGKRIAFNESDDDGGIWIVGATGESQRRLTDFGFNPCWSPDGEHIAFGTEETNDPYSRSSRSTLWRVPAGGGVPVELTKLDAMEPAWSPSGTRIAVWVEEGGQRDLATVPADGGARVFLLNDAPLDWSPTWSPDGRHVYFSSDRGGAMGLWRIAVDEATGRAEGEPEPVASGVEATISLPAFSRDGSLLAFRSETRTISPYVIPFDPSTETAGTPRELLRRTGILRPTSVSPDGQWLALGNMGERQEDIFVMRTDGSNLRRLTDDLARDRMPLFASDGERLTFYSNRTGEYNGYAVRLDGSALEPLAVLPDVTAVNYVMFEPGGERLLATTNVDEASFGAVLADPPWPFTFASAKQIAPIELPGGDLQPSVWSPDGRLIAGAMRGSSGAPLGVGVYEVATERSWQVSSGQGIWAPRWLPGDRIVYFTRNGDLVVVDADTGDERVIPVELPFPPSEEALAVSPDGTALYYGAERVESNIWIVERGR